jgi:uncharacterized membrane protein YphA (DoxX/SURF4 family)
MRLAPDIDLERRIERRVLSPDMQRALDGLDDKISSAMERYGVAALRIALAVVFVWFGVLKIIGRSPVEDLIAGVVYWLPADAFVRFLGGWEILVGVGLLVPVALRLTLLLFFAQMAGTFLVLVFAYGESFQDSNPVLLTVTGEFVVKNLVLIAAGIVIGSSVRRRREDMNAA